jgi:PBP1b-binding outer membrane lipoprotein LpoB
MKRWLILIIALLAAACSASPTPVPSASPTPTEQPPKADYPDLGAAPELVGDTWLNSDTSLRLADLRGKVVLVDMWTFG